MRRSAAYIGTFLAPLSFVLALVLGVGCAARQQTEEAEWAYLTDLPKVKDGACVEDGWEQLTPTDCTKNTLCRKGDKVVLVTVLHGAQMFIQCRSGFVADTQGQFDLDGCGLSCIRENDDGTLDQYRMTQWNEQSQEMVTFHPIKKGKVVARPKCEGNNICACRDGTALEALHRTVQSSAKCCADYDPKKEGCGEDSSE